MAEFEEAGSFVNCHDLLPRLAAGLASENGYVLYTGLLHGQCSTASRAGHF